MVVWWLVFEAPTHIHAALVFHASIGGRCIGFGKESGHDDGVGGHAILAMPPEVQQVIHPADEASGSWGATWMILHR
jgi:hypothetical protein